MDKREAIQHGLGYAAGREDGSGVATVPAADRPDLAGVGGFAAFAYAYGAAWDEYNREERYYMTNARDGYDAWQATGGVSIFSRPEDRTDAILARRAARTS